ncbi:MAG: ApaG domain, partial [Verrucomicrobia bacterium]|nr:ApaG domain [Verrucomicrobiota bacterium]
QIPVTLKGRKWVISHGDGTTLVVEGDGVVGQFPTIDPGDHFSYNSQHLSSTQYSVAEGSYLLVGNGGQRYVVKIPRFEMEAPDASV